MIASTTGAKVYYLPTAESIPDLPPASRWSSLRRRVLWSWWRFRLALTDVRIGGWRLGRRRRRRDDYSALLDAVIVDRSGELIERRPRMPARPATILDFEAGRLRLRTQTS